MSEQPKPKPNSSCPVWEMVIADMRDRDEIGRKRYGTRLQAGNGRDMLQDAYEEALDLAVYLRGAIAERDLAKAMLPPKQQEEVYKVNLSDLMRAMPRMSGAEIIKHWQANPPKGYVIVNDLG